MQTFLFLTAPIIYLLILLFSVWLGWLQSTARQKNLGPIMALLAGLASCPLTAVLLQLGQLDIPFVEMNAIMLCVSIWVGLIIGFGYLWLAKVVIDYNAASALFLLGSVSGSTVSLYFYFFYSQVQSVLIGISWGFLVGVLLYWAFLGNRPGGLQDAFGDLVRRGRR